MDETLLLDPDLDSASMTSETNKEKLKTQARLMKREDLEKLFVDKIIESIKLHSSVGVLHKQFMQALAHKDRLFNRVNNLHKQVSDLTKAVRSMSENVGRQKTSGSNVQPLRFYRSVGLQVTCVNGSFISSNTINNNHPIEPSRKTTASKRGTRQQVSTGFSGNLGAHSGLSADAIVGIGAKRIKPEVSVADIVKQVKIENQSKIRKITDDTDSNSNVNNNNINGNSSSTSNNNSINNNTSSKLSVIVKNNVIQPASDNINNSSRISTPTAPTENNNTDGAKSSNATTTINERDSGMLVDLTDSNDGLDTFFSSISDSDNNNKSGYDTITLHGDGQQQQQQQDEEMPVQATEENNIEQVVTPLTNQSQPLNFQIVNNNNLHSPNQQQRFFVVPKASGVAQQQYQGLPNNIRFFNGPNGTRVMLKQVSGQNSTQNNGFIRIPVVIGNNGFSTPNRNANYVSLVRPPVQTLIRPRPPSVVSDGARNLFVLPPLPAPSITGNLGRSTKDIPPRPDLTITQDNGSIILTWTLKLTKDHSEIKLYQIYACQEPSSAVKTLWRKVGEDVKALPLPMACTLSSLAHESRYHFIVRGVDVQNRTGPFCQVQAFTLKKKL